MVKQKFIHHSETVYLGNHYIGEANCLVGDMLELTAENEIRAVLVSTDFGSIEHRFLFTTLESHRSGTDFIQRVRNFSL